MAVEALAECSKQFNKYEILGEQEKSEVILYNATCMETIGQYSQAYELLESMEQHILDKTAYYSILGRLAIRLNYQDKVHGIYKQLFEINCENLPCALILLATHPNHILSQLFNNYDLLALKTAIMDAEMAPSAKMRIYRENLSIFSGESSSCRPKVECDYAAYCLYNSTPIILGDQVFDIYKTSPGWSIPQRQYMIMDRFSSYFAKIPFRDLFVSSYHCQTHLPFSSPNFSKSKNPFYYRTNSFKKWDDYPAFIQTRQLEIEEFEAVSDALKEFQIEFPKSHLLEQLKIALMPTGTYKDYCSQYLDKFFNRGVFNLYQYLDNILTLDKLLVTLDVCNELIKTSDKLHYKLSVTMLLSNLHHILGNSNKSLILIDESIAEAPTCLDLLTLKARILRDLGNSNIAADCLVSACKIDMFERDTSAFCARMLARDGRIEAAINEWTNYLRHEIDEYKKEHSIDISSMRFEKEVVRGYLSNKQYELAFNRCSKVLDQFFECNDEQGDFYNYSINRLSFISFKSYIYAMDDLFNSNYFQHFLKIYLNVGIDHSLLARDRANTILSRCHNCLDPGTILALYKTSFSVATRYCDGYLYRLQCLYRILQYGIYTRHSIIMVNHFLIHVKLDSSILNDYQLSFTREIISLIYSQLRQSEYINSTGNPVLNGKANGPHLTCGQPPTFNSTEEIDIDSLHQLLINNAVKYIKGEKNIRLAFALCLGLFECESVIDKHRALLEDLLKFAEKLFNFNNKLNPRKYLSLITKAQELGLDTTNLLDLTKKLYNLSGTYANGGDI